MPPKLSEIRHHARRMSPVVALRPLGIGCATAAPAVELVEVQMASGGRVARLKGAEQRVDDNRVFGAESASFTNSRSFSLGDGVRDFSWVLTTSITLTCIPERARLAATTQPSPPLFPGPVNTTAPSLSRST